MATRGSCSSYSQQHVANNSNHLTFIWNYGNGILSGSGIITDVCIYLAKSEGTNYFRLKVFRSNGTYWDFVDGTDEIAIGNSTGGAENINLTTPLNFQNGDVLGMTLRSAADYIGVEASGGGFGYPYTVNYSKTGNVASNTLKSSWTGLQIYTAWGMMITYTSIVAGKYFVKTDGLDTNHGQTWESAWKTIDKAANTLTDGQEVNIEAGVYNAEPTPNDIFPVNTGLIGIGYKWWGSAGTGTNDGTGTGDVKVEINNT